ncbi:MAG: hypothetical protein IPO07_10080 [Haliscomenobacter sp.]|nr:hypothetical protein [Haliscomenobacter sp.]MBK9489106.1 hypothetical protein [Haliscomenobacter sp.]
MLRKHYLTGILGLMLATVLSSCLKDSCETSTTYVRMDPVRITTTELRKDIKPEAARPLKDAGKIYVYEGYLIINEPEQGLHIIDNRNPKSPVPVSFVPIPGNIDMAIRNNILYADSWVDLVMFNIEDPANPKFAGRVQDAFPNFGVDPVLGITVTYKASEVTESIPSCDQGGIVFFRGQELWMQSADAAVRFSSNAGSGSKVGAPGGTTVGVGGSTARFTITENHLYTVDNANLRVFNLLNATEPKLANTLNIGWDIETIYPYDNKLFIGGMSGMRIYDATDPESPKFLSNFQHARACDPVVAQGNRAYVTLREGTVCEGFNNQLDVLDITDVTQPKLIKTYPLHRPIGLSITGEILMICESDQGLKVFNAKDDLTIDKNLLQHLDEFDAFDIIALEKESLAIITGKNGIYQYDYSNPKKLQRLSVLNIAK